jgi:hypothetical protein
LQLEAVADDALPACILAMQRLAAKGSAATVVRTCDDKPSGVRGDALECDTSVQGDVLSLCSSISMANNSIDS